MTDPDHPRNLRPRHREAGTGGSGACDRRRIDFICSILATEVVRSRYVSFYASCLANRRHNECLPTGRRRRVVD